MQKDIAELKKKADEGDLQSIVELGVSYLYGYGTEVDYVEAFIYLQDGALKNDGEAMLHLGKMFENGLGIKSDCWNALSLYRRSYKLKTPGSRKAFGDLIDKLVEEIPVTGDLTISNDFRMTCCCEKFKENMRMGKFLPFEDIDDQCNYYITNLNRSTILNQCPFCGCSVRHI